MQETKPCASEDIWVCLLCQNRYDRKRKKLDDRSKLLVYLGTEPGSKAYRLLDPEKKRIVVSCDVVIDEDISWNWSNSQSMDYNDIKGFEVTLIGVSESLEIKGTQTQNETEAIVEDDYGGEENDDDDDDNDEEEQNQLR